MLKYLIMKTYFSIFLLFISLNYCSSKPVREIEIEETPEYDKRGIISDAGNKFINGFDRIVYGLMDEAMHHVTDDKQGAFKDMLVRHRGDLYENIRKNLIHKDKITLDDIKKTVMGEINNRLELFNYVGSGLWKKISSYSSDILGQYKDYCKRHPAKLYCFNQRDTDSSSFNQIEREDDP